jgi:glutaminyl-tRNA synthetase
MGVVDPVKLTITNWPAGHVEGFDAPTSPDPTGTDVRPVPCTGTLWVEREDFVQDPPKKWFRLAPGKEVRLKFAYYVTCTDVVYDDSGALTEILCTYDPESRGGETPDQRKVKGTIHWVTREHGVPATFVLLEPLFTREDPEGTDVDDFTTLVNPDSARVSEGYIEPALAQLTTDETVQLLRIGYFCRDSKRDTSDRPVFNRTVTLKDSWARVVRNKRENE